MKLCRYNSCIPGKIFQAKEFLIGNPGGWWEGGEKKILFFLFKKKKKKKKKKKSLKIGYYFS